MRATMLSDIEGSASLEPGYGHANANATATT